MDDSGRPQRVAIAHDWLTIPGGSEKVVARMLRMFPQAEIFTSVYDPAPWPPVITSRPVHTSFLNRIPGATRNYPRLLPLMNAAFESFDFTGFGLVLSSSHACAKNVITGPDTLHVCYCHTPMRHAWEPRFLAHEDIGRVERLVAEPLLAKLRRDDVIGALRPDRFVANSSHVAHRIAKYYRREAEVIHPPVDIDRLLDEPRADAGFYLCAGRLAPYKRADLAVEACTRLGRPLKVAGTGRLADALAEAAGPNVELLGHVEDAELDALFLSARALLFPGEEDFGIVPVEAQAAGLPVIAYGVGGIRDTVIPGETGIFFADQTADALCDAILEFEARDWDPEAARRNARRFDPERFDADLAALIAREGAAREVPA